MGVHRLVLTFGKQKEIIRNRLVLRKKKEQQSEKKNVHGNVTQDNNK